ncbi:site-specific integrase [uncultured Desulfobulbus sp.]|uniref:site-specific integrase n=1 Tax=uncultured Desulfobulbus sp. TaxID=239745 RepID=UPI0029C60C53|nr:site-specific integrase [uncultured Desulfobulbus sp.]
MISKDIECGHLTLFDAQKALQHQAKTGSGNSANKDLAHFRTAWKWGVKYLDMPDRNVFLSIERFPSERFDRYVPPLDDFLKVYNSVSDDQDKLMLYCFLQTGARANEMWRLTWNDVDFSNDRIRLRSRKNRLAEWKSDWISVNNDLMQWLLRYKKATKGGFGDFLWKFFCLVRRICG